MIEKISKEIKNKFEQKTLAIQEIVEKSDIKKERQFQPEAQKGVDEILNIIPKGGLRNSLNEKISFWKEKGFTKEEIEREAGDLREYMMFAYRDGRSYLRMYNRRFADEKLSEVIEESLVEGSFGCVARLNLDMNGLKALNDIGGHSSGNEGLKRFSEVLKMGETTKWLNEMGLKIVSSSEGGDEFGLVISGEIDLYKSLEGDEGKRSLIEVIQEKYIEEIRSVDVSDLIDFSNEKIKEKLKNFDIEIEDDFRFEMGTSVGASTMKDVVELLSLEEIGQTKDQAELVKVISSKMFKIADERGVEHKEEYKKELETINPTLKALYGVNRQNEELIDETQELREINKKLQEKISTCCPE